MSTTNHRVATAASGVVGLLLIIGLMATPANASPQVPGLSGNEPVSTTTSELADPFNSIVDIDAERKAEQERKEEEKRKREEERKRKQDEADRKRRNQKFSPLKSGTYDFSARFGQGGGYWSSGRHTGLDFAAPRGTDVMAAQDGTVIFSGWQGAYGNRIEIEHADGTVTTYSHLSNIDVSVGDRVKGGQKIGDVGSTGNTTGAHLHFEVINPSGSFIDPYSWLGFGS